MKRLWNRIFKKQPKYPKSMFLGDAKKLHKELTDLAIQIAHESYSINLDFTHASIKKVEKILSDVHRHYLKTGETDGLNGIAMEFGCYISATIQNSTGSGILEKDHPEIGENTFPFSWNETTIFPYGWCKKRIFDGPGDNVESKYRILVLSKIGKT